MTRRGVVGELEAEIRPLDLRLKPVADTPVDIEDPDWLSASSSAAASV